MTNHGRSSRTGSVVVGVDGSPEAQAALRWALDEARLRNVPLRAVHAWTIGAAVAEAFPFSGGSRGWVTADGVDFTAANGAAEELLAAALEAVTHGREDAAIEAEVVEGYPADVLLGAVGASDLLVVGSRGRGALAGALLGSVSAQCVRHAPCPVVVVHAEDLPAARRLDASGRARTRAAA